MNENMGLVSPRYIKYYLNLYRKRS